MIGPMDWCTLGRIVDTINKDVANFIINKVPYQHTNGIKSSIRNIVNATESMKHALQMRIYISRFNYVDSDSHKVRIMMRQINAKKKNHKHISYKVPTFQIFITKFLWRHFLQDDFWYHLLHVGRLINIKRNLTSILICKMPIVYIERYTYKK